jgi:hypothetical protein
VLAISASIERRRASARASSGLRVRLGNHSGCKLDRRDRVYLPVRDQKGTRAGIDERLERGFSNSPIRSVMSNNARWIAAGLLGSRRK